MLTKHLIHHILVRGPSLNSGWLQCHALGGVAKGWGNWIGIRHWVSDNKRYPSLSHGLSALLWPAGIYLVIHSTLPSPARTEEQGAGHLDWLSLVVSYAGQWSRSACAATVWGCVNHGSPQSPGVICVIITIITLRLQEISTMASEEKPCLCSMMTTDHASKEQWTCCLDTY